MSGTSEAQPLVSIIIPAYNSAAYIAQAIDSALSQTYKNIEIIVAHRDSGDGTDKMLAPYIARKEIVYLAQDGKGLSNARNIAIRHARGEFITLLDADDIFLPERVAKQVAYFLAHPKCGACYAPSWYFIDSRPEELLKLNYTYYSGDEVLPHLLKRNFIAPSNVMLRRTVIEQGGFFNEDLRRSEDWEYWMRLTHRGVQFCFIPELLGKLRLHADSMSYSWTAKMEERRINLGILSGLRATMSPEERRLVKIDQAIFRHRLLFWYTSVGNYFLPLQWLHRWIQSRRLE